MDVANYKQALRELVVVVGRREMRLKGNTKTTTTYTFLCTSRQKYVSDYNFNICSYKREVCTGFWLGNLRERDHWGDPDVGGRIILRWIFRKWEGVVGTGWSWLRIGTGGGHL